MQSEERREKTDRGRVIRPETDAEIDNTDFITREAEKIADKAEIQGHYEREKQKIEIKAKEADNLERGQTARGNDERSKVR